MSSLTTDDDSYMLSILERNPEDILDQLYQSSPTPTPTTDAVVNRTPSPISTAASRKRPRVVELRSENITVQKRCINMGKEEVREKEKGDEDKRRSEQEIGYKRKDEDITKKEITGRCQEERREEKSSVVRTIDDLKERPVRYFLMKCDSHYDLQNALDKQRWTSKVLHKKIADENCEVILIFSVRKSDYFQAYGRLISRTGSSSNLYLWDHHQRIPLSVFNIEWITITDLPYHETNHFHDPRNHIQPDSLFSDSQEIPENIGYQLCRLFDTKATEPQPTHPLDRHSDSESPKMTTTKPLVREEEDEDVHNTDPDTEDFDFLTMTYEEYIEKTQRNSQKLKEEKNTYNKPRKKIMSI